MAQFERLIKKFMGTVLLSVAALAAANVALYGIYVHTVVRRTLEPSIPDMLEEVCGALHRVQGRYELETGAAELLDSQGAWAMLLDDRTGSALWSYARPAEIAERYTATEIARFSRGYLQDYPVFVWTHPDGLLVVGCPKGSYTKQLANYVPGGWYGSLLLFGCVMLACDGLLLFILYYRMQSRTVRLLEPLAEGLRALAGGRAVSLREREPFGELAGQINQASEQLRRRDAVRANWIAGVSHDVRTPLSVILAEAELLAQDEALPAQAQERAGRIVRHSLRIRRLVNDLNLASKLDCQVQPFQIERVRVAPLLRRLAADCLNRGCAERFEVDCDLQALPPGQWVEGDAAMLERAVENLLANSVTHNPAGCRIRLAAQKMGETVQIVVADDGRGVTDAQLERLRACPHYMQSDSCAGEPRHGLGLLIVGQIARAHHGSMEIGRAGGKGFAVTLTLPVRYEADGETT